MTNDKTHFPPSGATSPIRPDSAVLNPRQNSPR